MELTRPASFTRRVIPLSALLGSGLSALFTLANLTGLYWAKDEKDALFTLGLSLGCASCSYGFWWIHRYSHPKKRPIHAG